MTKGIVSLVGAGPGDPDLLTIRAFDRLRAADLVLYDALVAPEVVALAERAQRFSVGKRAGRKSVRQETITRVMVRAARRGMCSAEAAKKRWPSEQPVSRSRWWLA